MHIENSIQAPCFFVQKNVNAARDYFDTNEYVVLVMEHVSEISRDEARLLTRESILNFATHLASYSDKHSDKHNKMPHLEVNLLGGSGKPKRLHVGNQQYAISISHDANFSVVGIAKSGNIGIDMMKIDATFNWQETAQLFLTPKAYQIILQEDASQQFKHFCKAWTQLEASTKCCGIALQEFSVKRENGFQQCSVISWEMMQYFIISIARLS